jgi:hypothetical protein
MHKEPEVVVVKGLPSFTLDESRYIKKKEKQSSVPFRLPKVSLIYMNCLTQLKE